MHSCARLLCVFLLASWMGTATELHAATRIRIMPPDRGDFAVGQRFDIRVEATADEGVPPQGLRVFLDASELTARNILDPGVGGEPGAGGTGATGASTQAALRAGPAAANTTNFLLREYVFTRAGTYVVRAQTSDGVTASVTVRAHAWQPRQGTRPGPRARNVIVLLGDGMGAAHRTAARVVSRGVRDGKAIRPLAMDTIEVTGQVMTFSLNSVITDSSPGMASYATGQKSNNNQQGVFPDNTRDPFDNPRVEYIGELLRRVRGPGFNVGIVTTADVTDATPASNAVHTANRSAAAAIAARFFDEREANGVTVLMGGGSRNFAPKGEGDGARDDGRQLVAEYAAAGYRVIRRGEEVKQLIGSTPPPRWLLGLFNTSHLNVAFDKVGAGRYSRELAQAKYEAARDQPMLDDMTRLALASLSAHSPAGFYLMVEGASIDKQAHAADAERAIWDTIELDNAVQVALDFARRTNTDRDPGNDTLVIVTADHECGGMALIAVGNERFAPQTSGKAVRDYAAVFRFAPEQQLEFVPNYVTDAAGYPIDPDPSRKLLIGWAAAPDRFENWISNRYARDAAIGIVPPDRRGASTTRVAVASPMRDSAYRDSDNTTVSGEPRPGFLVQGVIENGEHACAGKPDCPADTSPEGHTIAGHTGTDVPLSARGPGALQFTGTYDNTDVFLKMLRSVSGTYGQK